MNKRKIIFSIILISILAIVTCFCVITSFRCNIWSSLSAYESLEKALIVATLYVISLSISLHFVLSFFFGMLLAVIIIAKGSANTIFDLNENFKECVNTLKENAYVYVFVYLTVYIMYFISYIILSVRNR